MITMPEPYTIEYSNQFKYEGKTFAFRKKMLFDITTHTPNFKPILNNNGSKGIWINRKWVSISKIKSLISEIPIVVDVSHLQWYIQEQLKHCINL